MQVYGTKVQKTLWYENFSMVPKKLAQDQEENKNRGLDQNTINSVWAVLEIKPIIVQRILDFTNEVGSQNDF